MGKIKVFIVDDLAHVRERLRNMLELDQGLEEMGEAPGHGDLPCSGSGNLCLSGSPPILAQEPDDIAALRDEPVLSEDVYQVLDLIFDGTIRLRSSRFLHVDVDFAHFPGFLLNGETPDKEEGSLFVQQQADYVRLQESRKIRLNEIHYFDHPIFGVILRVSRLKQN